MSGSCVRRFGVELEYNSIDKLSRSVASDGLPDGIFHVGNFILESLGTDVIINKWHNTHNNLKWVVKPDSSCGIEVCSPPMFPQKGISDLKKVINTIKNNKFITSDIRCSFHVHVEILDFKQSDLFFLIQNWIKFEPIFFMLTNPDRWNSNYCKPLSFYADDCYETEKHSSDLMDQVQDNKYFAVNLANHKKGKKNTVEFRIMGGNACLDAVDAASWTQILIILVQTCKLYQNHNCKFIDLSYGNFFDFINFIFSNKIFDNEIELKRWIYHKLIKTFLYIKGDNLHKENLIWKKLFSVFEKDIMQFIKKEEQNA